MSAAYLLAAARFQFARMRFRAWHWLVTHTGHRHYGARRMCVAVKDMHFALEEMQT